MIYDELLKISDFIFKSFLHIWPYLGRRPAAHQLLPVSQAGIARPNKTACPQSAKNPRSPVRTQRTPAIKRVPENTTDKLLRRFGKPAIRNWIRLTSGC